MHETMHDCGHMNDVRACVPALMVLYCSVVLNFIKIIIITLFIKDIIADLRYLKQFVIILS